MAVGSSFCLKVGPRCLKSRQLLEEAKQHEHWAEVYDTQHLEAFDLIHWVAQHWKNLWMYTDAFQPVYESFVRTLANKTQIIHKAKKPYFENVNMEKNKTVSNQEWSAIIDGCMKEGFGVHVNTAAMAKTLFC